MSISIGKHKLSSNVVLAPMAGVTDLPFRLLCKKFGAGLVCSEMVHMDPKFRDNHKTQLRMTHEGEPSPRATQILGNDPAMMADAARYNADLGADIIDINMGCPAKKVCKKAAGSALMGDVKLSESIIDSMVKAVQVPVTLKIRLGLDQQQKNAIEFAKMVED